MVTGRDAKSDGDDLVHHATDLAALLRTLRTRRGLSQLAAADAAGIQPQTVRQLEQAGGDPRLGTVRRYAAGLGCGVELVLRDDATGDAIGRVVLAPGGDAPA